MHPDTANLARIQREASNRLDVLSARVSEGRDVLAAAEFCKWLGFSGILMLLTTHSNSQAGPLKIDGSFLRWKCDDLLSKCNERFRTGSESPQFEKQEFESMHEKIDRMAGYLSRLSVAPAVSVAPTPAPEFKIISGGLTSEEVGECVPVGRRSARLVNGADEQQDCEATTPVMN